MNTHTSLSQQFESYLSDLKQQGLHRQRQIICTQNTIDFSSSDYLSLASDTRIRKAYQEGFRQYSVGSTGSMVVCGYHSIHKTLEQTFAEALGVDDCLLFSSGYAANLGLISLLGRFNVHALIDKGVHASIYDGLKLANLRYSRYLHVNLTDLALKIKTISQSHVLITESVFSMSGQIAPLTEIARLGKHNESELLVDEAHAFGVLGAQGLGGVSAAGLTQDDVPLRIITFGKAYVSSGAIIAGRGEWIDALLQSARSYIYSTAISPAAAYGLLKTFEIIRTEDKRRTDLYDLIWYFRHKVEHSLLSWRNSSSPIQQLQLGCPYRAIDCAAFLRQRGIVCLPMRQPTVSRQETGLRVILNHHHEPEQIDYLFECLHEYENKYPDLR